MWEKRKNKSEERQRQIIMRWTEEQEQAIGSRGSDILVSAAAGSGKTAVLTERIKQLILKDGISVDEMLVVTFSNAAAAEMREKILKSISGEIRRLVDETASSGDSGGEKHRKTEFLRTQLRKAHSADISTFHKFSMNIIRRYFYLTDTEADFAVCDEARRQILQGEALGEMFDRHFEEEDEAFLCFLRQYAGVRSEEKVKEMILSVYRFIMTMPRPFDWLEAACRSLNAGPEEFRRSPVCLRMMKEACRLAEEAKQTARQVCDMTAHLPSILKKAESDLQKITGLCAAGEDGAGFYELLRTAGEMKYESFRPSKDDKEDYGEIKAAVTDIRNVMKKRMKEMSEEFASLPEEETLARIRSTGKPAEYLCSLVKEFHGIFTAKKREKSLVDFNDIEHLALQILDHEEAASDVRKHFRVIFVDEYQDSSILQETLIQKISRGDNVYMVGDVKQSIYKFRLAEPEIFVEKYHSFAPYEALPDESARERRENMPGRRIDLNRNFRCKGNIVRCVNGIFSAVMDEAHGGIAYDANAALRKGVAYEGELDRPVTLHLVDSSGPDEEREDVLDEEIAELAKTELEAKIAAGLVAERLGMEIYDCKKEKVRTVGYGDIVILLRGVKGSADIYAEALKEQGIPSYIDAGEGYFETMEIEVFMNLLRVIDNRRRDIPLISVLRSPIFGLTVKELIDIRLSCRSGSYSEAFLASESEKCAAAREKLNSWRLKAKCMPLEDFLWMLMQETGYLEYASALPGGDRRAANLRALVDKAVAYAGTQNKGLFGFIRYVELLNENRVSTGQSAQQSGAERAVRIMTIHKSKGLEFPVVILGGLGRKFRGGGDSSSVVLHKDLGLGLLFSDPDRNCCAKTMVQRTIERQKDEEQMAEEMRILYVAMTRAMDELVLLGSMNQLSREMEKYRNGLRGGAGNTATCFLDWIIPNMEAAGITATIHDRYTISDIQKNSEEVSESFRQELENVFEGETSANSLFQEISSRFFFRYPYESDVFSKSKFTVSELNRILRGDFSALSGKKERENAAPEDIAAGAETDMERKPDGSDGDPAAERTEELLIREKHESDEEENVRRILNEEDSESAVPRFLREKTEITAAMRGTYMHKVMELIPFREDMRESDVQDFLEVLTEKNILTEEEAQTVSCAQIAAFFHSDAGKRACRAGWLKREWPFTLKKNREELAAMAQDPETAAALRTVLPEELLIQGIIDCCFEDEDGITVIDYKTDYVPLRSREKAMDQIRHRYENQVQLYRDVIRRAFDTEKIRAGLWLFRASEMIEV